MFGLIPLPWKLGFLALAIAASGASGYVLGRKHVRMAWDAQRAVDAAAEAKARGIYEERERMWTKATEVAGEKFNERIKIGDAWAARELGRLRASAGSSGRMPSAPGITETCAGAISGGPGISELQRAGEAIVGLVQSADRDRAALVACVDAWPKQ